MQLPLSPIAIPVQNSTLATLTGPLVNSSIILFVTLVERGKFQIPSSKEAPSSNAEWPRRFGVWNLGFLWSLVGKCQYLWVREVTRPLGQSGLNWGMKNFLNSGGGSW
jgi:hypothetical protein